MLPDGYSYGKEWRRERDSNPRWRFKPPYSLSRGAPSASRPSLLKICLLLVIFTLISFWFALFPHWSSSSCNSRSWCNFLWLRWSGRSCCIFLLLNSLINFFSMHGHIFWCIYTNTNLVTFNT